MDLLTGGAVGEPSDNYIAKVANVKQGTLELCRVLIFKVDVQSKLNPRGHAAFQPNGALSEDPFTASIQGWSVASVRWFATPKTGVGGCHT